MVASLVEGITDEERRMCHMGVRTSSGRMCHAYAGSKPKEIAPGQPSDDEQYPSLAPECLTVTWWNASDANNWGSCVNSTMAVEPTDGQQYRYFASNSVPPYYFNPYCPFGLYPNSCVGSDKEYCAGYCINGEACPFPDLKCGKSQSEGYTEFGDVWVPQLHYSKLPLVGNPTRDGLPMDMYQSVGSGAHSCMATTAVHFNGNSIQGPNDAGAISVDVAGFQLMCGGHVTPPVLDGPLAGQPMFHYHKASDCTAEFTNHSVPTDHGGTALRHGNLFAYAIDGFGLYGFEDIGGVAPILDECGGHFGPVHDKQLNVVEYHYHATTYTPYHLACQGPALGHCEDTQHGASFCGEGCGAEVCAQPGTSMEALHAYTAQWNVTWLDSYTNNLANTLDVVV